MTTNDNNASHAESGNDRAAVLAQTQTWVEKAVIGLNLCPFAKAVQVKKQIRYTVTEATSVRELHTILSDEIQLLLEAFFSISSFMAIRLQNAGDDEILLSLNQVSDQYKYV